MSLVRIPDTPLALIRIAREIDRLRAWSEAEGLGWPSLLEELEALIEIRAHHQGEP
jgi:hypothetical protein